MQPQLSAQLLLTKLLTVAYRYGNCMTSPALTEESSDITFILENQ